MDNTTLIVVVVAVLVVVAVVVLQRVSWGSAPGYTKLAPYSPPAQLDPAAEAEVRALLAGGNKIAAIKRVRELTGLGLKEAKDYVESQPGGMATPAIVDATRDQSIDRGGDPEVQMLLAGGNKIAAIKRVRELTGMGLKEAKDYVESGMAAPPGVAEPAARPAQSGDPGDDPEVQMLLAGGNKIAAIKRVRELTGLGLKEAKDYVDALERRLR